MPTVAERIDPASPHYDPAFAELRRKSLFQKGLSDYSRL